MEKLIEFSCQTKQPLQVRLQTWILFGVCNNVCPVILLQIIHVMHPQQTLEIRPINMQQNQYKYGHWKCHIDLSHVQQEKELLLISC